MGIRPLGKYHLVTPLVLYFRPQFPASLWVSEGGVWRLFIDSTWKNHKHHVEKVHGHPDSGAVMFINLLDIVFIGDSFDIVLNCSSSERA